MSYKADVLPFHMAAALNMPMLVMIFTSLIHFPSFGRNKRNCAIVTTMLGLVMYIVWDKRCRSLSAFTKTKWCFMKNCDFICECVFLNWQTSYLRMTVQLKGNQKNNSSLFIDNCSKFFQNKVPRVPPEGAWLSHSACQILLANDHILFYLCFTQVPTFYKLGY